MTDETDTAFLQGIKKLGWKTPKDGEKGASEEVQSEFGGWSVGLFFLPSLGLFFCSFRQRLTFPSNATSARRYPTLLDTVLLSQGKHFVGTSGSTSAFLLIAFPSLSPSTRLLRSLSFPLAPLTHAPSLLSPLSSVRPLAPARLGASRCLPFSLFHWR